MVYIKVNSKKLLQTLKFVKGAIPNKKALALKIICDITIIDGRATFAVPGAVFSIECKTKGTCKAAVTFIHLFLVVKDIKVKRIEFVITEGDLKINDISIAAKTTFFKDDKILKTIQLPINYRDIDLLNLEKNGYTLEELDFNNLLTSVNRAKRNMLLKSFPENISTQIQAVKYSIENMDIKMIDALLDNDITYQNLKKPEFTDRLRKVFEYLKRLGDTFLISMKGECVDCGPCKTGYTFTGDKSGKYLSFVFDTTNNTIKDIFECTRFVTKDAKLNCNNRLYIDDSISQSM